MLCQLGVDKVIKQDTLLPDLKGYDYLASGDGFEPDEIKAAKENGCELLNIIYTQGQSSIKIKEKICKLNA